MRLDLKVTPFSYHGSYFAFQYVDNAPYGLGEGLYLKSIHRDAMEWLICKISPWLDGKGISARISADASVLRMECGSGEVRILFGSESAVQFEATGGIGLAVHFVRPTHLLQMGADRWEVGCFFQGEKLFLQAAHGRIVADSGWDGDNLTYAGCTVEADESGRLEGMIELYRQQSVSVPGSYEPFETARQQNEEKYKRWLMNSLSVPPRYENTKACADYLNWANVVSPYQRITRWTLYSSKRGMPGIWSWDHLFHAMAFCKHQPDFAWDQYMIFWDVQDPHGGVPDTLYDTAAYWGFVKPPVHGFALKWMLERSDIPSSRLEEAYGPLAKWTQWWFTFRDSDGDGVPEYLNGNDSGWDNSTAFYEGVPAESPDLSTYLILQMEVLSDLALRLGKNEESQIWMNRSRELLQRMLDHFWNGERFVVRLSGSHQAVETESLLMYIPLLLGDRLSEYIRNRLVDSLFREGKHLTPYGLASEAVDSPLYEENGYWRGPVWAPPMFLLCHALREIGETAKAAELAERFCRLVEHGGFAENFDALTGEPLRDPTINWTACIFLLLAHEYVAA